VYKSPGTAAAQMPMNSKAPFSHPATCSRRSGRALALLCVLALAPGAAPAATQVYRTFDAEGRLVLSDRPPPPGTPVEVIELRSPNTFLPPTRSPRAGNEPSQAADPMVEANPYRWLRVVSPPHQAAIRENAGNVVITAAVDPELRPGDELQVYTNGVLRQRAQSLQIPLMHLDRGTHEVELRVVDETGNTVIASEPSVFHLQRRSVILQPAPRP